MPDYLPAINLNTYYSPIRLIRLIYLLDVLNLLDLLDIFDLSDFYLTITFASLPR